MGKAADAVVVAGVGMMYGLSILAFVLWSMVFLRRGEPVEVGFATDSPLMFAFEMWGELVMWLVIIPIMSVALFIVVSERAEK